LHGALEYLPKSFNAPPLADAGQRGMIGQRFVEGVSGEPTEPAWREKLIKIRAKVVSHGRYTTFQIAEVAVPRQMLRDNPLSLTTRLRASPAPA